ncbi:MAG: hypothetical protein IT428_33600 [Planctomycetaceae bacterium]|nr:hypothetical protein [Planctomycetaceae bacterium]
MNATRKQSTTEARIARIRDGFAAWGIELASVTQTMPATAPRYFRVNVTNLADMPAAKAVAAAVADQYKLEIVVVYW